MRISQQTTANKEDDTVRGADFDIVFYFNIQQLLQAAHARVSWGMPPGNF